MATKKDDGSKKAQTNGAQGNKPQNKEGSTIESPTNAMPLFYQKPTPLDAKLHAKLALKKDFGLEFTKEVNAVPINLIEMPQICHFYPIAFSPDNTATPVAICGLRDNENLYVNDNNQWESDTYIPAYIRPVSYTHLTLPTTVIV